MPEKKIYHTKKGFKALKEELFRLETQERPLASKHIAEAREKGDLRENAEYHAAKEHLALLEERIAALKGKIADGQIIDEDKIDTSKAVILTKVTLKDQITNKEKVYQLVPAQEANLRAGKISIDSPIGRSLLGKKKGEIVAVPIPRGIITYKILNISI